MDLSLAIFIDSTKEMETNVVFLWQDDSKKVPKDTF